MAMIGRWVPTDFSLSRMMRGLETIHVGHLHVHQDQIEAAGVMLPHGCQRFHPVPSDDNGVSALLELARGDQLVDAVVLGQENAQLSSTLAQGVTSHDLRAFWTAGRRTQDGEDGFQSSASLIGFKIGRSPRAAACRVSRGNSK